MSEGAARSDENKRFETGLKRLLRSAYHPPEPREEFKATLLNQLKAKQVELVAARNRKRRIHRLTYLSTAMAVAAALAFVLGVGIFYQQQAVLPPSPSVAPVVGMRPAPEPVNWAGKIAGKIDASWNGGGFAPVSNTLVFNNEPVKLRTTEDQAGVELAPGVRMVMDKDSLVSFKNGRVQIDHGHVSLSLNHNATPIRLALPYHEINVHPGSRVDLKLAPAALYALGGRPAPEVTLLEGFASIRNHLSEGILIPGKTYRLYNYPDLAPLIDNKADLSYPNRADSWIKPTFVNFQTTQPRP